MFTPELEDLPKGWMAIETAAVIKCIDESGEVRLLTRTTDGLSHWEALGMHEAAADACREDVAEGWEIDDE